jgi:hypothetical protein
MKKLSALVLLALFAAKAMAASDPMIFEDETVTSDGKYVVTWTITPIGTDVTSFHIIPPAGFKISPPVNGGNNYGPGSWGSSNPSGGSSTTNPDGFNAYRQKLTNNYDPIVFTFVYSQKPTTFQNVTVKYDTYGDDTKLYTFTSFNTSGLMHLPVVAVPEAQSFALGVVGLGIIGLAGRRKR